MASELEAFVHAQAECWNRGDREGFFAQYRRVASEGLVIEYVGKPPIIDAWAVLDSMWAQQSARIDVQVVVGIASGNEVACHNRNRLRDDSGAIETIELYRLEAGTLHVRYFIAL
jgi:hypothetical protein